MATTPNPLSVQRAQRLLEAMHPVCSHDLPNQAVALQSLLQLFAWDEAAKLSPQGREYFERLQSVARKTLAFTQFLKEADRIQKYSIHAESVSMAQLADDVRVDAQRLFPETTWTWRTAWQVEQVRGDHRLMQHGLVHLLRATTLGAAGGAATVEMKTLPRKEKADWTVTIRLGPQPPGTAPAADVIQIEQRLALALAVEYFAAGDIACRQVEGSAGGETTFALVIPGRSLHG